MSSKGEKIVEQLLTQAHINFKKEVSFSNLKSLKGKLLRFDFILFNRQNKIIAALEVDGQQHFQQVSHFQKTTMNFRQTQECDRRKNTYCLQNNIPLIRIPYWAMDNLTITDIFTNPDYRVRCKEHNDLLRREVRK